MGGAAEIEKTIKELKEKINSINNSNNSRGCKILTGRLKRLKK